MFGGRGFPFGGMGFDDDDGPFGGMGGMRGGPKKDVDTQKYYDLLGVDKKADTKEITKAFRKLALKHHPDKGGDVQKFQEMSQAHDVLTDPKKRDVYDQYGEEGLKEGGGRGGGGMDDIFSMFGGGRPQGGGQQAKKRCKPFKYPLKVSLEEVYNGKKTKIAVNRERVQPKGDHKMDKNKAVTTCGPCKGRGMVMRMQQLGPGMYTQTQGPCEQCKGQGETLDEKNWKIVKEKKIIDCEIDKGCPNGQVYTFYGEADEWPGAEPGDVIVQVQEQQHKTFKRKGADLMVEKEITLLQALTGVDFVLEHLDGEKIRIKNTPGEVIKPDDIRTVKDKGLPFHKQSYNFGNLYVVFKVQFPKQMPKNALSQVGTALAAQKASDVDMDDVKETCLLVAYSESDRNKYAGGQENDDEDDDEDDGRQGQRVQCGQ